MNTAQLAFVREQFAKWVEETDVAEQCGLTRKEMIDSVEFNAQRPLDVFYHRRDTAVRHLQQAREASRSRFRP